MATLLSSTSFLGFPFPKDFSYFTPLTGFFQIPHVFFSTFHQNRIFLFINLLSILKYLQIKGTRWDWIRKPFCATVVVSQSVLLLLLCSQCHQVAVPMRNRRGYGYGQKASKSWLLLSKEAGIPSSSCPTIDNLLLTGHVNTL